MSNFFVPFTLQNQNEYVNIVYIQGVSMEYINFENQILEIDKIDFVGVDTAKQAGMPTQYTITAYKNDNTEQILFSSFDIALAKKACSSLNQSLQASNFPNFAQIGYSFVNLDCLTNINIVAQSIYGQVFYTLKCKFKSGYNYDVYNGNNQTAEKLKYHLLKICKAYKEQKFFE